MHLTKFCEITPSKTDVPTNSTRQQPVSPPPLSSSELYGQKMDEQPRRKSTNKYGDEGFEWKETLKSCYIIMKVL